MSKRLAFPALATAALTAVSLSLLTRPAHAQSTVNYTLDADNDMALYVGNADASVFRQVVNKTTGWPSALSGTFNLNAGEDYFYMLSLNYGGPGDIGGFLNGVSVVDMNNWFLKDVTGQITGFPSGEDPTFNPNVSEIQSLVQAGGFSSASPSIGYGTSSPILGTNTFVTPTGNTATLYRQSVTSAGVTPAAAAPEPGSIALLLAAGVPAIGLIRRRKSDIAKVPTSA